MAGVAWAFVALILSLCAAQTVLDPSSIDKGAKCEGFSVANVNCQGVVPVGTAIYLNSTMTQQIADGRATYDATYAPRCPPNLASLLRLGSGSWPALLTWNHSDPPLAYNFTATGGEFLTPDCTTGWNATSTCPTKCLRPDFQDETKCCAIRCPLGKPLFGETKYRAMEITNDVLGYFAFFSTCITVFLFAINPVARKFPGMLIIVQGGALIVESFGTIMTSFYGVEELQCNPDRYMPCNFQGFFVSMGAQLALTYWLVLNAITCVLLYSNSPKKFLDFISKYHWYLALLSIYPILSISLTAWAANTDPGKPTGHKGVYYGLGIFPTCGCGFDAVRKYYVIWSLILVCLGTAMWFASVIQMFRVHMYSRKHGTSGLKLRMHLAIVLYQLLVFCTAGLFCVLFLIARQTYGGSPSKLQSHVVAYVSGDTNERPDGKFGLIYAITFVISFVALFYSLVFGLRSMHFEFLRGHVRRYSSGFTSSTKGSQGEGGSTDVYTLSKGDDNTANGESRF